ncbi:hypothetical protein G6F46_014382 [Rhizopus delemar]|nr:hypothetical protein G6F46_014382 [Rhizopus delemar]
MGPVGPPGHPAAGDGGQGVALDAVRADAGDAADRLGDAVGRGLPDRAVGWPAPAADRAAHPGAVCRAAQRAQPAGLCIVRHGADARGGGAVPPVGAA